ncbi:MAG: hypothetical protein ACRDIB_04460, partial [Ardenticatenaceae bacterium]
RTRANSDATLAALALGLGLTAGPGFWSVLAAGALAHLIWGRRPRTEDTRNSLHQTPDDLEAQHATRNTQHATLRQVALRYLPIAFLAFVIVSTGLLTNLQGLGAALNLPAQWLRALFGLGPALAIPFLFALILYEGLALVTGLVGASLMAEERGAWVVFSFVWLAVTLVPATLANSGWSGGILFVVLPLTLVGASTVVRVLATLMRQARWQVDGLYLLLAMALFVYFWIALTRYLAASQPFGVVSLLAPVGLLIAAAGLVWQSFGKEAMQRVLGLTLLFWLTIVSIGSAWGVSVVRGADPREPLVTRPSDSDLRTNAAQLAQLSVERYRDPGAIPLGIQRTLGYAPRWYFRNFDSVSLVEGSHAALPEAALLESDEPPPPGWIGRRIWLGPDWQWNTTTPDSLLRWLTLRADDQIAITDRAAVLYIKLPGE